MKRVALANGTQLDVLDCGPADAPALIFLHGFPESHRTWRHQVAHFSDRFRCIAPDQRGYRGSSKPQDVASYTPDKLIGDVFQLADALGIGQFTVVGHDWGGAIAWGVALLGQGTRVTRAVIANAPHPALFQKLLYIDPVQRAASQYMREFRDPANDALVREHGLGGLLLKAVKWERSQKLEPEVRDAQFADWQDRDAAFAMLNWYRASPIVVPALDEPLALPDDWQEPPLPPLEIPTLVIWAMDDLALPPCNLDGMDAIIPSLTLCPVHGCGHFVPWEDPQAVNAAMDAFLAST
ncbi:alpha/beta fold hydrolase [Novosphingobium sp. TH158]|uniref:alpha/beta fold hydrolase n=1 Tax=Novosphingobium sp. TH158 TaxID=2067455 RepID=UPI000C7DB9DF|nr:alpha/beta hydrolase [Novosphingobium sp. TH158]PLK25532.1 alpha/beta hydrolase [Novosphingobium sp. TH158]